MILDGQLISSAPLLQAMDTYLLAQTQLAMDNWGPSVLGTTVIGSVLWWLMQRVETILKDNTKAIREQTKSQDLSALATLAAVLTVQHQDIALTKLAAQLKEQIEANQKNDHAASRG